MVIIKQPARPLAPLLRVQPAKCHQCGGKIKQGEYTSLAQRTKVDTERGRLISMAPHYSCKECYEKQNM